MIVGDSRRPDAAVQHHEREHEQQQPAAAGPDDGDAVVAVVGRCDAKCNAFDKTRESAL